jgi:hypothetical protein
MQDLGFNQRDLGHGASGTILHPAVLVALVLTIVLTLTLPRKYVAVPVLLLLFLAPRGQEIYLAGLHWYLLRLVLMAGFVRLAQGKFQIAGGMNAVDKAFIVWAAYRSAAIMLTNGPSAEEVGLCFQAFVGYFLMRHLIQNEEDIARVAKTLAVVAAILGACMLNEQVRQVNIFGYLGGARLYPEVRNGQIRAQATFGHSILAGCFGAALVPLFFWLWKSGRANFLAAVGLAGSTTMVFSASSSTPLLGYVAGLLALFLWPIRKSMRVVRRGIVLTLVVLALVMKAPVWFIIAHVNVIGGSGGYDRAFLIDTCMRHFRDWWFIGTNQNGTWGFDMWDLSDQFVAEAEKGGLVTVVCFIAMISRSFSRLGRMRRQVGRKEQWLLWSLGSVMLAHILSYFGVAYWDQTQVWWFAFLSMISAATAALKTAPATAGGAISKNGVVLEAVPVG